MVPAVNLFLSLDSGPTLAPNTGTMAKATVDIRVRATAAQKKALAEKAKAASRPLGQWLVLTGMAAK